MTIVQNNRVIQPKISDTTSARIRRSMWLILGFLQYTRLVKKLPTRPQKQIEPNHTSCVMVSEVYPSKGSAVDCIVWRLYVDLGPTKLYTECVSSPYWKDKLSITKQTRGSKSLHKSKVKRFNQSRRSLACFSSHNYKTFISIKGSQLGTFCS